MNKIAGIGHLFKDKLPPPIRITLIYALVGVLWVLFSEKLLNSFITNRETLIHLEIIMGWAYVLMTAIMLYMLIQQSVSVYDRSEEKALQESEINFKALAENAFDGILVAIGKDNNVYVNKKMVEITGYNINELLKMSIIDLASPDEKERLIEKRKRRLDGIYIEQYKTEIIRKDGKNIPIEISGARTYWHNEVASILLIRDITDRQQAEEALWERTRDLKERVKELNCLYAISNLVEKRNISLEDILLGTANIILPALQYPEVMCVQIIVEGNEFHTKNFQKTKWELKCDIVIHGERKGVLKIFYFEERPVYDEGLFLKEERSLINAIAELLGRIIERRQTEDDLLESEQRFRDLVQESLTGIIIIQDDKIVYKNPEQERLYGPLLQSFTPFNFNNIHAEDVDRVKQSYQEIVSGKNKRVEMDFRLYPLDKIGSVPDLQWVYYRAVIIEYQGREAILINMMDITEAKKFEHFARIQDKMSSLGRVAAGIAHEIRNPLSGINIYLDTLKKINDREGHSEKANNIISKILSASKKIESVIRRVMDFAKPSEPKFNAININKPVEEAINLSSVTLRKSGIKLDISLDENVPLCTADPQLVEQVVLNLITNAAEAMKKTEDGKRIEISSLKEDNNVIIKVSDSGPGVPQNIKETIFDPFYSTKQGSTGIGLSICHRIISDHKGFLKVSTNESGGAEFRIEFPIMKGIEK